MQFFSYTAAGPRPTNQDSVLAKTLPGIGTVCCVADGVGGNKSGEVASSLAVHSFLSDLEDKGLSIRNAIENAHARIILKADSNPDLYGMATTFTAVLIDGSSMSGVHCGDSRAYLLSGNEIRQLTTDHSEVASLLSEGILTEDEALNYPRRNVIYSALGGLHDLTIDEFNVDLCSGDRVVLVTDGFYKAVPDQQLIELSSASNTISEFGEAAVNAVQTNGTDDNYSLVAIDIR